jgi:L-fuculose-phosphate aldolase
MRVSPITPRAKGQVLGAARALTDRGLVTGTTGNLSLRHAGAIIITPSRMAYESLRPRDLVTVAADGTVLRGRRAPSRELPLHLAVYAARPDAGAVVHTHTPHATAWSFLDRPLRPRTEEMEYYAIGEIRTSARAPAGSTELARHAVAALGGAGAVLLGGHGALALGADLDEALAVAEAVEHQAHVAWLLHAPDSRADPALRRIARGASAARRP